MSIFIFGAQALHVHAAIDGKDMSGDISGLLAGKENHRIGDIVGTSQTLQRNLGGQLIANLLGKRIGHGGCDKTGGNCVDGDAAFGQLAGIRLGKADQAGLAGTVIGLSGRRPRLC